MSETDRNDVFLQNIKKIMFIIILQFIYKIHDDIRKNVCFFVLFFYIIKLVKTNSNGNSYSVIIEKF